jgi:hypothetical protein
MSQMMVASRRMIKKTMAVGQPYAVRPCRFVPTNGKAERKAGTHTASITWYHRLSAHRSYYKKSNS